MNQSNQEAANFGLVERVVILGGGTAGWMTASYLKKAFPRLHIVLAEAPGIPKIGVGEATIPNLQKVFFDFLGLDEDDWMRRCNAAFKVGIKFENWQRPRAEDPNDYFYHLFGLIPECKGVPLSHYWALKRHQGSREPLTYACYKEPPLLDAKLSPRYMDGTRAMYYAWHFDAHLVADYLRDIAVGWGVEHHIDTLDKVELTDNGSIGTLHMSSGRKLAGDLFIDCSGFRGLLINKALQEPFVDMSNYLLCDSAVATQVPNDDQRLGVDPYTSAIAMDAGWTWKIPMLGRFGTGHVYASRFMSDDQATRDFCNLWGIDEAKAELNKIRFRVGRNRQTWVKNCVSIGLSSCFLEPLESTGIYFIYAAIYQLAKHFPDKSMNPRLIRAFNGEIESMFDECRDFIQAHYCLSPREDTDFWRTNRHELKLADDLQEKLDKYRAGLSVNQALSDVDGYYTNFEHEFRNFWTNSSFYCVLGGLGVAPEQPYPKIRYDEDGLMKADELFAQIKTESAQLAQQLPSNYEFLKKLHSEEGLGSRPRSGVHPRVGKTGQSGQGDALMNRADFRTALASLASGVTVVTTKGADGIPLALTATAFNSVSAEPPLCMVCLHKDARITEPLGLIGKFVVNVLSEGQQEIAERCASGTLNRLASIAWTGGPTGDCPMIDGALASIECEVEEIHSGGDHEIVVGRIRAARSQDGVPLVYFRSSYSSLIPPDSGTVMSTNVPQLSPDVRMLAKDQAAQRMG